MKGPRELKRYFAKHRKYLKACRWDDLRIFQLERCKKWFKRRKHITNEECALCVGLVSKEDQL